MIEVSEKGELRGKLMASGGSASSALKNLNAEVCREYLSPSNGASSQNAIKTWIAHWQIGPCRNWRSSLSRKEVRRSNYPYHLGVFQIALFASQSLSHASDGYHFHLTTCAAKDGMAVRFLRVFPWPSERRCSGHKGGGQVSEFGRRSLPRTSGIYYYLEQRSFEKFSVRAQVVSRVLCFG